jgi:septal ring factor EnvC (AmiA/AmiB activator)
MMPDHRHGDLERRIERLEDEMTDVAGAIANLQGDDAALQASVAQIQTDAGDVATALSSQATQIAALQAQIASLQAGGTVTADQLAALNQVATDLGATNDQAQAAHGALTAALPASPAA